MTPAARFGYRKGDAMDDFVAVDYVAADGVRAVRRVRPVSGSLRREPADGSFHPGEWTVAGVVDAGGALTPVRFPLSAVCRWGDASLPPRGTVTMTCRKAEGTVAELLAHLSWRDALYMADEGRPGCVRALRAVLADPAYVFPAAFTVFDTPETHAVWERRRAAADDDVVYGVVGVSDKGDHGLVRRVAFTTAVQDSGGRAAVAAMVDAAGWETAFVETVGESP